VISCIDYRFWPRDLSLLAKKFGRFDLLALAGGSKNLASPTDKENKLTALENIRLSIKLHGAKTIVLTNHSDCGAYGGSKRFSSQKQEVDFHKKELLKAKSVIRKFFPDLRIKMVFVTRNPKTKKISLMEL